MDCSLRRVVCRVVGSGVRGNGLTDRSDGVGNSFHARPSRICSTITECVSHFRLTEKRQAASSTRSFLDRLVDWGEEP